MPLAAAYLAGAGINAVVPAHAGDVTKVFLVKRQIPDSSYPAVTSSFLVQTVFDTTVGDPRPLLRDQPGPAAAAAADPRPARLRDLLLGRPPEDAGDHRRRSCCWRSSVGIYFLAHRVRRFWDAGQTGPGRSSPEPRRYLREVAAWQGVGWLFRFAAFWFFLEAFGIGGSIGNVMLVMSVQAIANIIPFTPGGAGAQQALLVATLTGPLAHRRPLLLGRHPDRDGGLVGRARLRRDPARLPHHRLARPDPPGPGGRRRKRRRRRASSRRSGCTRARQLSRSAVAAALARPARDSSARSTLPLPGRASRAAGKS